MNLTKEEVRDNLGLIKLNARLDAIEEIAKIVENEQRELYRKKVFEPNVTKAFENIKDRMRAMTR